MGMVERRTVEERRVISISAVGNTLSRELERHRVRPTGITNCPARQTAGRVGVGAEDNFGAQGALGARQWPR